MKTGKLPVEKWKPEDGDRVWILVLDVDYDKDVEFGDYYECYSHADMCFRTRALAEKALKKIKQVLKEAKHE